MKKICLIFILSIIIFASCSAKEVKFKHVVKISHEGSRSQSLHGFLYLNGKKMPDFFIRVITEKKCYSFFRRSNMWGRDGYFPLKNCNFSVPDGNIYLEWKSGNKIVKLNEINKFISENHFKTLKRFEMRLRIKKK